MSVPPVPVPVASGPRPVSSVPASVDNPSEWEALADQITRATAIPPVITPEMIAAVAGSAVPLLFAADATANANLLRGTFADPVIAQCAHNGGVLMGAQPVEVVVHLVGSRVVDGHPVVRVHLTIHARGRTGEPCVHQQFWDLQCGGHVTVGQICCPNCGAPVATGELLCGHCHTDVRRVVDVPLVVSRLELY
jgi:hypothetical protein